MRLMLNILLLVVAVGVWGCQQEDKRVNHGTKTSKATRGESTS